MSIDVIISAISSFLLAMGGSGLLFWRQSKRLKEVEVRKGEQELDAEQTAQWKELYERRDARVRVLDDKVDALYTQIHELQKTNDSLSSEIERLKGEIEVQKGKYELEIEQLKYTKCVVRGCKLRQPPHLMDFNGNEVVVPDGTVG